MAENYFFVEEEPAESRVELLVEVLRTISVLIGHLLGLLKSLIIINV
jgi:hypothetical protein